MTISYQEEIKFISNKIRELRKEKQMTVQELAYRCDMERSNMSRIESGRTMYCTPKVGHFWGVFYEI